jgi:hypothetical protein
MIKVLASLSTIVMVMSLGFLDIHDGPRLLQSVSCNPENAAAASTAEADAAADAEDSSPPLLEAINTGTMGRAYRNEDNDDSMASEACGPDGGDHFRQDAYAHLASGAVQFGVEREQENRNKVVGYLLQSRNVGSTLAEMADKLAMNAGTLEYYLEEFEHNYQARSKATRCYDPGCRYLLFTDGGKEHRFIRLQEGKYTRLWPGEFKDKNRTRALIFHLRDPIRSKILETIVRHPGVTNVVLSQSFNRNKSTMHNHLKQLHDADLISIRQEGRAKRCFARDDVLSMIGK